MTSATTPELPPVRYRGAMPMVAAVLPAVWLGLLACVAFLAAPAAFATLDRANAGHVVGWMFAREAPVSLAAGAVLLTVERQLGLQARALTGTSQFTAGVVLSLVTLACTILGYYALLPMMEAARAGQGALSFGQLHGISLGFYTAKMLALAWLTVRAARRLDRG